MKRFNELLFEVLSFVLAISGIILVLAMMFLLVVFVFDIDFIIDLL